MITIGSRVIPVAVFIVVILQLPVGCFILGPDPFDHITFIVAADQRAVIIYGIKLIFRAVPHTGI